MTKMAYCKCPVCYWKPGLIRQIFSLKDIPLCYLHNPGVHTSRISVGCSIIFYRKSLGTLAEGPPGYATWQPTPCCYSVLSRQNFKFAFLEQCVLRVSASRGPNIHLLCTRRTCNYTLLRSPKERPPIWYSLDLITHCVGIPMNQHTSTAFFTLLRVRSAQHQHSVSQ
jgi:hypothetical protein